MPRHERIGVVGAGIIGCAVAFELARRGAAVTVFDGRRLAGGATQASAGILAPYTEAHAGGVLNDLAVRGLDAYDEFVERVRTMTTVPFEYRRSGTLEIAEDEDRASQLRARLDSPSARAARLQWLDADAVHARAPLSHRAPSVDCCARRMRTSPSRSLWRQWLARHRPWALGSTSYRWSPGSTSPRRRRRCTRRADRTGFDRVVLCAGAWTPTIDPFGYTQERIRPVRGQLVRLMLPALSRSPVLWGRSCYLVPWEDGSILVGATSEEVGFDERPTAEGVGGLLAGAGYLVPALRSATFIPVRVGLRPASSNDLPILGPSAADPRLVYAAGHFRNGVLLAPRTATLIANYIFDNTVDSVFSTA